MKNKVLVPVLAIFLLAGAGCKISDSSKYSTHHEPVCVKGVQRDIVAKAVEDVLVEMGFDIEKFDTDAGYIRTHPLRAKQPFEFWRGDTTGKRETLAAALHTERRTVEVNLYESGDRLCVDCSVLRERLSVPNRQAGGPEDSFGGVSEHIEMNTEESIETEKLTFENARWESLGEDKKVRAKILTRLSKKLRI